MFGSEQIATAASDCYTIRPIVTRQLEVDVARILNVLLIEDDKLIQYAMVEGLTDAGHVVSVAGTFKAATDVLTRHHYYDVILLDLRLGADRGEDIFLKLREQRVVFPPVIIVSAQPKHEISRAMHSMGAAAMLQKPVMLGEICEAMARVVG